MTPDQLAKSGSEHAHQRALFAWCNMAEQYGIAIADDIRAYTVPHWASSEADNAKNYFKGDYLTHPQYRPLVELHWFHAIHNQGHGDAVRGGKAKAEGVKPGVLDCFLPLVTWDNSNPAVNTIIAGLYIEMKVGNNKTTTEQNEFIEYCQTVGYKVAVCYSWIEARDVLIKYYSGKY